MSAWVRLWSDMPNDPKWRVVARRCGRPVSEVMAVFVHMMTNAGAAAQRGQLESWSDEDVAIAIDAEAEHVAAIREAMQGKVLEGDRLAGWERRQPKREDNSTDRVNKHRERVKDTTKCHETQCNAGETLGNAPDKSREDIETDIIDSSLRSLSSTADEPPVDEITSDSEPISLKAKRQPAPDKELILDLVDAWNFEAAALGLPQVHEISNQRKAALRARLKDFPTYGFDDPHAGFRALLTKIRGSPFLTGQTSHGFRVDFDFVTNSSKFHKIMEGSYEAKNKTASGAR